jgi:hypothetical protein
MKAAIGKSIEDLVKNPEKARELPREINRARKDLADPHPIVVDGKRYRVRLAGSAPLAAVEK